MTERKEGVEATVDDAHENVTLAALVREALPGTAWNRAKELCTTGRVFLDGAQSLDPAIRLKKGQIVRIEQHATKLRSGTLSKDSIVYVDHDIVVVRKPANTLTLPFDEGDRDTLVDQTRAALRRMDSQKGFAPELGVVQRLDKDTTGLLVFTRSVAAKKILGHQFREHTIRRRYIAIVHGMAHERTFDSIFIRDRGDGLRGSWGVFRRPKTNEPPADAQRSITHTKPLENLKGATLIECHLETGRQHQIRIHLSESGHMLVGEEVYVREHIGPKIQAPRIMLHAVSLGFVHPRTGRDVFFEDDPPADFQAVYESLRLPR